MESHGDRTILAAVITGICVVVAALISSPHWLALFGRTDSSEIQTQQVEDESSDSGEQTPQKPGVNDQNAASASLISSQADTPGRNPDPGIADAGAPGEPDELSPDANHPKPASLPEIPDGYIQPGDIRGEVNKPKEKELPSVPDNTIKPVDP